MLDSTQALTVLAEIRPDRLATLRTRLQAIADDLDGNAVFRPSALPDTHFMRFVIVDDAAGDLAPLLAWESNHDGRATDYLARVGRATPSIDQVFEACVDYPGVSDGDAWIAWMLARSHRAAAFYCAYRCRPRRQVVNDGKVHAAIRTIVDRDRTMLDKLPALDIQREIGKRVARECPELELRPVGDSGLAQEQTRTKRIAIALGILALPLAIVLALPWFVLLKLRESRDKPDPIRAPVHDNDDLQSAEDQVTQNQLTHVVDIKPGLFSLFTVWIVLTVIDVLARIVYVEGDLGGITSIHFARWVIVRDHRNVPLKRHRLLFFSNYDGSWESYLGEFIDRAAKGLTAIWSNTQGFPKTTNLWSDGATDEEAFKQWTRDHQIPTQVWWSGVPQSTVQNVRDNIAVRCGLEATHGAHDLALWLGKL